MEENIRKEIEELKKMIEKGESKQKIQEKKEKLDKILQKYLEK